MENTSSNKILIIKNIYFYLVSFVALMMVVFATANLINILLKTYIFTAVDQYPYYPAVECDPTAGLIETKPGTVAEPSQVKKLTPEECAAQEAKYQEREKQNMKSQRQRSLVTDISFIVVGIPLFAFHWYYARKKLV